MKCRRLLQPTVFAIALITAVCITYTDCQELPINDGIYVLRNIGDGGGIVRPLGDGLICERLSRLSSFWMGAPPYPETFHWKMSNTTATTWHISSMVAAEGSSVNELYYDDYPPYCFLVRREIELVGDGTYFQIRDVRGGRCYTSYGSEVAQPFWQTCGGPGSQSWQFVPV